MHKCMTNWTEPFKYYVCTHIFKFTGLFACMIYMYIYAHIHNNGTAVLIEHISSISSSTEKTYTRVYIHTYILTCKHTNIHMHTYIRIKHCTDRAHSENNIEDRTLVKGTEINDSRAAVRNGLANRRAESVTLLLSITYYVFNLCV